SASDPTLFGFPPFNLPVYPWQMPPGIYLPLPPDPMTFIFPIFSNSEPVDPLLIDIDGDGVETTPLDDNIMSTYFDMEGDGFAERTAWVGEDDGILFVDRNNDGVIN